MPAYYYIEDLIDFDVNSELEIEEGLVLKAVPSEQLEILKGLLVQFGVTLFDFNLHEHKVKKKLETGGANLEKRENDDYRYFVLEHSLGNQYDLNFASALQLMGKDFFVPFGFAKSSKIGVSIKYSFEQLSAHTYFNDKSIINFDKEKSQFYPKTWDAKSFTPDDKSEFLIILKLLRDFENVEENYVHISKALDDFFKINEISNNSVFKIVSYIACLELLLIDNGMDRLKSLNIQLQSKVNLINNRLETPIVVSNFFNGPDSLDLGTVIGKIYNYRSSIAHGDFLDFEKKLKVFEKVTYYDVLMFLRIILKQTILFALKEPQLITDLKRC